MRGVWRVVAAALTLMASASLAAAEDKAWPIDVTLGKADAPNTVIEYFSLDCPHCARFEAEVFPKLKADFIDTGKAKWVMRDFPLHDAALAAAMIAHCAGDRYLAFVDAFFQTQAAWAGANDPVAAIKITARIGGMDGAAVDKCLGDNDLLGQINARSGEASDKLGVRATPTFFIDGAKVEGEISFDDFAQRLSAGK